MKFKLWMYLLFMGYAIPQMMAQTVVKGWVRDERNQPLSAAVVMHLKKENEQLIQSVMTDEKGVFRLENVSFESEKIKIASLGYHDVDICTLPEEDTLCIRLQPLAVDLAEVAVTAQSYVVQKKDRLVFQISNINLTENNNTFDLLKFTPLLTVKDDKLSMIGKSGVLVYVNGRKSNLGGDGVENYLKTLPAQAIQSIEVITNPNSTVRREGDIGIINLVLKKNEQDGINGMVSLSDNQSYYNSQNASLYLAAQKNKWNISANFYGLNNKGYQSSRNEYRYYDTGLKYRENARFYPLNRYLGGSVNLDYHLADSHTLGVMVDSWYKPDRNR